MSRRRKLLSEFHPNVSHLSHLISFDFSSFLENSFKFSSLFRPASLGEQFSKRLTFWNEAVHGNNKHSNIYIESQLLNCVPVT